MKLKLECAVDGSRHRKILMLSANVANSVMDRLALTHCYHERISHVASLVKFCLVVYKDIVWRTDENNVARTHPVHVGKSCNNFG